jgi:hypothetical protein
MRIGCSLLFFASGTATFLENPFVMIMNGDGQGLFGMILADTAEIELPLYLGRLRNIDLRLLLLGLGSQFFVQDLLAKNDAIVTDVNARPRDQLLHLGM